MNWLIKWLLALALVSPVMAQDMSVPTAYVNDYAHVLSEDTKAKLNHEIADLAKDKETQIFVAIIPSLNGQDIDSYKGDLFRKWKPGRVKSDKGLLEVVAINDHKYGIEVGYGLEGQIPDGKAGDIGRSMVPYLKSKDYNGAITTSVEQLILAAKPTEQQPLVADTSYDHGDDNIIVYLLIALLLFIVYLGFAINLDWWPFRKKKYTEAVINRIVDIPEPIPTRVRNITPHYDIPSTWATTNRRTSSYTPPATVHTIHAGINKTPRATYTTPAIVPVVIPETHHSRSSSYGDSSSSSSSYSSSSDSSSSSSCDFSGGWGGDSGGGGASGDW